MNATSADRPTPAARLIEHGAPLRMEEVELPAPGAGEVRVQLLYAGINPVDRYAALGLAAQDAPLPRTLGMEAVGTIGERIVLVHGHGLAIARDGLWAAAAVVPEASVIDLPDGVSPQEASAIGVAGATAWRTVVDLANVTAADRVLVLGATGGVGSVVVTLCASIGATVWALTSDRANEQWLGDLGAERVIVAGVEDLGDELGDWRPSAAFDPLGDGFTGAAIQAMAPHGRLVTFGTSVDGQGSVPLQELYRKGLTVLGYAGLLESDERSDEAKRAALAAMAEGRLRITVDSVFPLSEVNSALQRLASRGTRGKLVLDLRH